MEKIREQIKEQNFAAAEAMLDAELKKRPDEPAALLLRSTLDTRQSRLEPALKDAERAVILSNGSPEAQLRRAICLWRLKRVGEAKSLVKYFGQGQEASTWKQLIENAEGSAVDVPRIPKDPKEAEPVLGTTPVTASNSVTSNRSAMRVPTHRTDWYQRPSSVTVVLYRKGLDPQATKISIGSQQVLVDNDAEDFHWSLNLSNSVDTAGSTYELTPYKVEFVLKKSTNHNWETLEQGGSSKGAAAAASPAAQPVKPQSKPSAMTSYSKWDNIDDDEDSLSNESDPMRFFQNLYKDAPPEVQRAMMKSYIESNGTALSTNWEEVSKEKVKTQPPSDMEAKDWHE